MTYQDPPVNPYDPEAVDNESQTRPLDQVIRDAVKAHGLALRVSLPAIVTAVDGDQKVDVQPALQIRYIDQSQGQDMPVVQGVPVSMPMGAGYAIRLPVAVGDTGYLVFSDRSLDSWLAGDGGIVDPQDARQHDLSDAIFIPALVPFSKQTTDGSTDLYVVNGSSKAEVRLQKSGKILLGGKSASSPAVLGDVLINGLDSLNSALNNLNTATETMNAGLTAFSTACQASVTDPVLAAAAATLTPILATYSAALTAFAAALAAYQSQYLDTAATNVASQQTFLRRGP